jgi:hypothetical protein
LIDVVGPNREIDDFRLSFVGTSGGEACCYNGDEEGFKHDGDYNWKLETYPGQFAALWSPTCPGI